jgi:hypothetical protein
MTPEAWLTLFRWMSGISAVLVAISVVGQLYFSSIVDKNKDDQINKLKSELQVEKTTIRDFYSDLQIVISGNWTTSPASYIPVSPVEGEWYIVFTKDKTNVHPIRFMAQQYSFNNVNQKKVIFVSRQAVLKGEYPTGQSIHVLSDYDTINFYIPFKASTNDIKGKKVLIEQVAIKFFLNSKRCNDILYNQPLEVEIDDNGWATFNIKHKDRNLFYQLQLEQKL